MQKLLMNETEAHPRRLTALHTLNGMFLVCVVTVLVILLVALDLTSRARQDCDTHEKCLQLAHSVPDKAVICSLSAQLIVVTAFAVVRLVFPAGLLRYRPLYQLIDYPHVFPQASWRRDSRTRTSRSTFSTLSASGCAALPAVPPPPPRSWPSLTCSIPPRAAQEDKREFLHQQDAVPLLVGLLKGGGEFELNRSALSLLVGIRPETVRPGPAKHGTYGVDVDKSLLLNEL